MVISNSIQLHYNNSMNMIRQKIAKLSDTTKLSLFINDWSGKLYPINTTTTMFKIPGRSWLMFYNDINNEVLSKISKQQKYLDLYLVQQNHLHLRNKLRQLRVRHIHLSITNKSLKLHFSNLQIPSIYCPKPLKNTCL